eukprot:12678636-Alexandrium_andersonii.AAC.1
MPPRARPPHPAALPIADLAAEGQRRVSVGAVALDARWRPGRRSLHWLRGAVGADPPASDRPRGPRPQQGGRCLCVRRLL